MAGRADIRRVTDRGRDIRPGTIMPDRCRTGACRAAFTLAMLLAAGPVLAAAAVAEVNPVRHSGGFAKQKNNHVFSASTTPVPLMPRETLTDAEQKIVQQAERLVEANATTALLLVDHGQIVFERYKSPADSQSPLFSQSMSKSLTALVIGNLLCQGRIASLDDRADQYAEALAGSVQGEATIRQLLTMSSGAKDAISSGQQYEGEQLDLARQRTSSIDVIRKYGLRDTTLSGQPLPSGKEFRYNAIDTYALAIVADALGGFFKTFDEAVWQPAGTGLPGYWIFDKAGFAQSASGFSASGRDWARLAMYTVRQLKQGSACMQQFMKEAGSAQLKNTLKRVGARFPAYGYQMWVGDFGGKPSYWWVGYGGQRVGIQPETEKIIVLTSYREDYMDAVYKLFTEFQKP